MLEGPDLHQLHEEAGGLRVQRVPPTEKRGRIHTSTVTVAVLDPSQHQTFQLSISDVRVEWFSGSGAGGQHRNKHQNSCRLTHLATGLQTTSQTRSRQNSYQNAFAAMQELLAQSDLLNVHRATNLVRQAQVGSGERGDKIRTIQFQNDRVVDHRTQKSMSALLFMKGHMNHLWN